MSNTRSDYNTINLVIKNKNGNGVAMQIPKLKKDQLTQEQNSRVQKEIKTTNPLPIEQAPTSKTPVPLKGTLPPPVEAPNKEKALPKFQESEIAKNKKNIIIQNCLDYCSADAETKILEEIYTSYIYITPKQLNQLYQEFEDNLSVGVIDNLSYTTYLGNLVDVKDQYLLVSVGAKCKRFYFKESFYFVKS